MLKGETRAAEAARRHGLKVAEVEGWRDRFLLGAENALRAGQKEDALRPIDFFLAPRKVGLTTRCKEVLDLVYCDFPYQTLAFNMENSLKNYALT